MNSKHVLILLFIGCFFCSIAQHPFFTDNDIDPEPGFYRNFTEFRMNQPSMPLPKDMKIVGGGIKFGISNLSEDFCKKLGTVYGFCDGNSFFIVHNLSEYIVEMKFDLVYSRIEYMGRYSIYTTEVKKYKPLFVPKENGGRRNVVSSIVNVPIVGDIIIEAVPYILNVNNGKAYELNKKNVSDIVKSDSTISMDSFKNIEVVLMAYSERHKDELKMELSCAINFYRLKDKQKRGVVKLSIQDEILPLNEMASITKKIQFEGEMEVCINNGACTKLFPDVHHPQYVECYYDTKKQKQMLKVVEQKTGEVYSRYIDKKNKK